MADKILLDTSILVDYFRFGKTTTRKSEKRIYNSTSAKVLIVEALRRGDKLYTSVHTIKELLQYPSISDKEKGRILNGLPNVVRVLPTTWDVAVVAGDLAYRSAMYRENHIEDCYIAAWAIVNQIPLYTRNPNDFKYVNHPQLTIVVPYQNSPKQ